MKADKFYYAILAQGGAVPAFLCGHCQSILSRSRIFRNDGEHRLNLPCQTVGLCSADDCGAINCCDGTAGSLESPTGIERAAS